VDGSSGSSEFLGGGVIPPRNCEEPRNSECRRGGEKHGSDEDASDVRSVVIDANVLVSFVVDRNDAQREAAKALS